MNSGQCDMKPIIKTVCIESIANGPRELAVAITGRSAWQQNRGKKKGLLRRARRTEERRPLLSLRGQVNYYLAF